jgi:uncharacterized protein (TIGR03437 family)
MTVCSVIKFSSLCLSLVGVAGTMSPVFAHSYGPAPRVTAAPGDNAKACTQCHTTSALNSGTGSVTIVLQGGAVYIPGIKQRVTVRVADPAQQRWGFELTARLNSDLQNGQAGDLIPVDNFTQVICEDASIKPCIAGGVSFIQHTSAGTRRGTSGGATFEFDWMPPSVNAGPVTLYAAGNAANGDGTSAGDLIYTTSVQVNPVVPVAPVVSTGNIVSGATSGAGPLTTNSWVTVYGTNLGATTRAWTTSDFSNGGMPVSLDGVSVVLTANGAPRRAYIGYTSPTQVNFLLPSDIAAATVQVQVKNPAGISDQAPITVQANAPQLITWDGKYVSAAHANGDGLGKTGLLPNIPTTPATPGETVVLYVTGFGATNPALIPGQVPAQTAPIVTPPVITIGGANAVVVSAAVPAGSAGVCQINVQIPANAPNGDQQVVVQLGTVTSNPALITIQR